MQIHEVHPNTKLKKKKRVGRGGKRGTFSGKGMKGQKSRAGAKLKPIVRDLLKRYPKLRGHNFSPLSKVSTVSIFKIDSFFEDGAVITPKTLVEKGILQKSKKNPVKILATGTTNKKFYIKDCEASKGAKEIIEKAGGKVSPVVLKDAEDRAKKKEATAKKKEAKQIKKNKKQEKPEAKKEKIKKKEGKENQGNKEVKKEEKEA